MNVSDKGLAFIASHEGLVLNAYLDPVGIVTIGYGFTNRSRVFSQWAKTKWGRKMRMGDKLTQKEASDILRALLEKEYEPPVEKGMPADAKQHEFDAATSATFNLGPKFMTWKAAKLWKSGQRAAAAEHWRSNYNKAGGRRLPGLVRRRKEEAHLFLTGEYPGHGVPNVKAETDISDLQRDLEKLGYEPGPVDGDLGPLTKAAIREFQKENPPLVIDGIAGPATRAAIARALKGKPTDQTTTLETLKITPAANGLLNVLVKILARFFK